MKRFILRRLRMLLLAGALLALAGGAARAQSSGQPGDVTRKVGLDQKLGAQVPLDLAFFDETGKEVRLGEYFGKGRPVILNLIFYKCPGTCLLELDGMLKAFIGLQFTPGKEFEVVTVSINPKETPELAAAKKDSYLSLYKRPGAEKGWHFLTGSHENIQKLAGTVGFRYTYDLEKEQFAHDTGIMIATPEGKLSHYMFGMNYEPKDLRLSLIDASKYRIGTPVEKVLLAMCYQYDPTSGKYGFAIVKALQVGGIATVLTLLSYMLIMFRRDRRLAQERRSLTRA